MALRCPECDSGIPVDREPDRLAPVCPGCGRRREHAPPPERPYRQAPGALRDRQRRREPPVRPARLP